MFHVALYEPEIPPNTGNIIRLCANAGVALHLIEPLGFTLGNRELKRAGLDYHEFADIEVYPDFQAFRDANIARRIIAFSTHGSASAFELDYKRDDVLLFGPETRGLPPQVRSQFEPSLVARIPMQAQSRSLNLSNAVAIVVFEAWRQLGFAGAAPG